MLNNKITSIYYTAFKLVGLFCSLLLWSCSVEQELDIDYSFDSAINVKQNIVDSIITNYDQIDFEPHENLDLGFHKGNIWIKLEIANQATYANYMVITGDLINRNYRFYKLDTLSQTLLTVTKVDDLNKHDHRTFNDSKPNFEINLAPNETATFYISTTSDGRILQGSPELLKMDTYRFITSTNSLFNIIFFIAIGLLFLINVFHWSILKNKIYYYYGLYIFSSCLFYLNVEGYLYGIGFTHQSIDHFMFMSIRFWILSAVLFTAQFLDLNDTNPKFYTLVKWLLIIILGGTTLYQFIFYNTSIRHLHLLENILGFLWVLLSITMIIYSLKKRRLLAKYYLIAFSFLLTFVLLGLVDSHTTILPGDPFSYFKVGTFIEFCGFTYFIAFIIKQKLLKATDLEFELIQNKQQLEEVSKQLKSSINNVSSKTSIEKTDLLSIFKLLESSLSTEEDWPAFKSQFEALSPHFLANLNQAHPNLTKSEIRLIILIRIGFSQKEMANILNIATGSVKKAKQRARKKLGLSKSVILTEYLSNFN